METSENYSNDKLIDSIKIRCLEESIKDRNEIIGELTMEIVNLKKRIDRLNLRLDFFENNFNNK